MNTSNWLVSPKFDLLVFGGPAVLALGLVALESRVAPSGQLPLPMWVLMILVVDVAHVWSTIYRSYLDPQELKRRPQLYVGVPVACYLIGFFAYSVSKAFFWSLLAYVAVFHFIRQQYGWVALYNRRAGDREKIDLHVDRLAIYASTVFPILWWHAHLPRKFSWFMPGDFIVGINAVLVRGLWPVYVFLLLAYVYRQIYRWQNQRIFRGGKNVVILSTALCWGIGIIVSNTDWAFTVTNVLIHGVPYVAIVWVYGLRADHSQESFLDRVFKNRRWGVFLLIIVALAYSEEWVWDRLIWHEHSSLFPFSAINLSVDLETLCVPLLALPQATHYVLDAWIWKTKKSENPQLAKAMALASSSE